MSTMETSSLPPKDFSYYYGDIAKGRAASSFKQFYKYFAIPGIANVAGGEFSTVKLLKFKEI